MEKRLEAIHEKQEREYYSRNYTKFGLDMNRFVSIVTAVLVLSFIGVTVLFPEGTAAAFSSANAWLNAHFNWLYVLTINGSLALLLFMGVSKFGKMRLGGYTSRPEFKDLAWYAMMFSAGIGIGIFFYGVAEPFYHLEVPSALESGSAFDSFKVMYLHWGAHAWAVYGLFAIGLGYFAYNKGLPFAIRSLFYPVLKDKIYGLWGDVIDTVATLAVLFGLATSLGLGAKQINAGFTYLFGLEDSPVFQVVLIILITLVATVSVVSGVSRGIKWLSEANLLVSALLLLGILLIGPTSGILATYLSSLGIYLRDFLDIGLYTAIGEKSQAWQGSWTIFYWAWWISWAPFVGTFIARISKGRTIRQIALGILILPTVAITLAMTILGASGRILDQLHGGVIKAAIDENIATSIFAMFAKITKSPVLRSGLSIVTIVAVIIFFVTSSDSGSLVVSSLSSSGRATPPKAQRIFWALMEGGIAMAVLLMGGSAALSTIQSAVVILGFPFSLIFLVLFFSLGKELQASYKRYHYNHTLTLKRRLTRIDEDAEYK